MPYSDGLALISAGPAYTSLTTIARVMYGFDGKWLVLARPVPLATGKHLRLGHWYKKELVYSDGVEGPHQPFRTPRKKWYTDDAPNARIYCNGKRVPGINGFAEYGNPWVIEDWMWFEARQAGSPAPGGWENWKRDLRGMMGTIRVTKGANPAIWNRSLYFGRWNGECFDIGVTKAY